MVRMVFGSFTDFPHLPKALKNLADLATMQAQRSPDTLTSIPPTSAANNLRNPGKSGSFAAAQWPKSLQLPRARFWGPTFPGATSSHSPISRAITLLIERCRRQACS